MHNIVVDTVFAATDCCVENISKYLPLSHHIIICTVIAGIIARVYELKLIHYDVSRFPVEYTDFTHSTLYYLLLNFLS